VNVRRVRDLEASDGHAIPALLLEPAGAVAGAVLMPPYGGGKEHMLGLAVALAERRVAALAIDSCGHGENPAAIGAPAYLDEMESAIAYARRYGNAACVGISIGGRLALMSSADCMAAISPSVVAEISPEGKWMFENFPSPTVREPYSGYVNELLQQLGPVPPHDRPCLLLYAERDIPMILQGAQGLHEALPNSELRYVSTEMRPDVVHDAGLIKYLPRWFNHMELKFNREVMDTVAQWVAKHQAMTQPA
jgi:dienelactone hydrolase